MTEPRVPERQGLEISFLRARWFAAVVLAFLLPTSGHSPAATAVLVALTVVGNAAIWWYVRRVQTLAGQRRLGVLAVVLDAAIVLGVGLTASDNAAPTAFAALIVVVAEASVRYAPPKAMVATLILIALLAAAMGFRHLVLDDDFLPTEFAVIALLSLLAGTMIGSAVREVYRSRVGAPLPPTATEPDPPEVPEDIEEHLTPRERQVLQLIVRGYSNARIAEALVIEPKTVKNHINRIYGKLNLTNRYEAITSVLGQRREQP